MVNILGKKVKTIYQGTVTSDFFEINNISDFIDKEGIFFVRVSNQDSKYFVKKISYNLN